MGSDVELVIEGRAADVEGTPVTRVLPWRLRRMVGPWVFVDHMGPVEVAPGHGMEVRPHPHIGLATVTYLFSGEVVHRDSLGSVQPIRPGDLNWMVAGSGIVHSERVPEAVRRTGGLFHGLQLWVALPAELEESAPSFRHYPSAELPQFDVDGVRIRLLAGSGFGRVSPVQVQSPLVYAEITMPARAVFDVPPDHEERAVYVVDGRISCDGQNFGPKEMLVLTPRRTVRLQTDSPTRVMLLGGSPLGSRFIWWNFVSSSHERIERAREAWRERRFPSIPGDDVEFVPLPGT